MGIVFYRKINSYFNASFQRGTNMTTPTNTPAITQCPNCNGGLVFNPAAQRLDCPYCRSTYTLQGARISSEAIIKENGQSIIPFSFAKEIFDKGAMQWLSQGDYTPADILDSYRSAASKGMYIPVYLWNIAYLHTSPMGNRTGKFSTSDFAKDQSDWPAYILTSAKTFAADKNMVKPFNTAYTLGFEMAAEDSIDSDDFKTAARQFALAAASAKERVDPKTIVITEMELSKVYVPFWINKYTYQSERHQVIMSGNNDLHIDGSRPVDTNAAKSRPSFKWSLILLGVTVGWFILMMIIIAFLGAGNHTGGVATFITIASVLIFIGLMVALAVAIGIAILRSVFSKNPITNLAKLRAEKLAQRLRQHA